VPRTRIATAALIAMTLAAASGCAWFEPEEEDLDFAAYEDRLTDMYNESVRLNTELDEAESRMIQDCMEEQGFTLHDADSFPQTLEAEQDTFLGEAPYEHFLPTVAEAERRGFWHWGGLDGAEDLVDEDLYAEYEAMQTAMMAEMLGPELAEEFMAGTGELAEFYYLPPEDQYAWYVAFGGEAWAAENHPDVGGGGQKEDASGEPLYLSPPPAGCRLETIEAVYGELRSAENEEEGFTDWISRPEPPNGDWEAMDQRYAERVGDAGPAFLDCLADRGSTGWEFENDALHVIEYLTAAGETVSSSDLGTDDGGPWPEVPDAVPDLDDVEGWLEFERDLAVDFAECADESGYREAAEHAWEQAQLRYYLDIEDDTYAWQEEMRGYLTKAQEVIGG